MPKQLHVANLSPTADAPDLTRLFAAHGTVRRAEVLAPSRPGAQSTSALVEMASDVEGADAIKGLNGQEYGGHLLTVGWVTPGQEAETNHAPLFGSMNMAEESAPLVSHGPEPVDFGDRAGSGRDRGLPPPDHGAGPTQAAVRDWVQFMPAGLPSMPFRSEPAVRHSPGQASRGGRQ